MKIKTKSSGKKRIIVIINAFAITLFFLVNVVHAQNGEQLFQQCKACHTIGQGKLLGPDLLDVSKKRDAVWLKNFIKSSQTMVKIGNTEAVEIFEEFNKLIMVDYNLPDADIDAIIKYIDSFSTSGSDGNSETISSADSLAAVKNAEFLASIDTDDNATKGKALFQGKRKFKNGGASCISCHNVNAPEIIQGGLLAKDLTHSFSTIGGLAGIKGILEFPPYPAMKDAYENAALTNDESIQLQVFLMRADKNNKVSGTALPDLMKQGIFGVVILLIIISLVWFKRKKRSVNYQIIKRQRRFS
jgi:cytochrome c2